MSSFNKLKIGVEIKKKSQGGGVKKLSPISQNYKKYLQGLKPDSSGSNEQLKSNNSDSTEQFKKENKKVSIERPKTNKELGDMKKSDIKIIHKKYNKNKNKFTRKKPSKINVKDINEIERQIELSKRNNNPKIYLLDTIKKREGDFINKPTENTKDKEKDKGKDKGKEKEKPVGSTPRKNKRSSKRNNRKNSKKVSITNKKISQSDINKVESHIKEIRKKKTEEIRKELEDNGIKVSGKSSRLIKDIYLYSKICNINIQHEK